LDSLFPQPFFFLAYGAECFEHYVWYNGIWHAVRESSHETTSATCDPKPEWAFDISILASSCTSKS
jgi:hypothetical protein